MSKGKKNKKNRARQNPQRAQSQPATPSTPSQPTTPTHPSTQPNSNFNLNRVIEEGLAYQVNHLTTQNPDMVNASQFWIQNYFLPKGNEDMATSVNDMLRIHPQGAKTLASKYQSIHEKNLIEEVAKNYKEILRNTNQKHIIAIAEPFLGDDKYKLLKHAHETGKGITQALIAFYDNHPLYADVATTSPINAVQTAVELQVARTKTKELTDKLGMNDKGEINMDQGATYDATNVNTLPQEQRNTFYKFSGLEHTKLQYPTFFE